MLLTSDSQNSLTGPYRNTCIIWKLVYNSSSFISQHQQVNTTNFKPAHKSQLLPYHVIGVFLTHIRIPVCDLFVTVPPAQYQASASRISIKHQHQASASSISIQYQHLASASSINIQHPASSIITKHRYENVSKCFPVSIWMNCTYLSSINLEYSINQDVPNIWVIFKSFNSLYNVIPRHMLDISIAVYTGIVIIVTQNFSFKRITHALISIVVQYSSNNTRSHKHRCPI